MWILALLHGQVLVAPLRGEFGVPLAPPIPVMHLEVDHEKENPEEEEDSRIPWMMRIMLRQRLSRFLSVSQSRRFLEAHDRLLSVHTRVLLGWLWCLEDARGVMGHLHHELCLLLSRSGQLLGSRESF